MNGIKRVFTSNKTIGTGKSFLNYRKAFPNELLKVKNESMQNSQRRTTFDRTAIFVALIGLMSLCIGNIIQGINSQNLERQKFEANLITKAVETGNSDSSKKMLKFLLDAGLIKENESNIKRIISDTTYNIPSTNTNFANAYVCNAANSVAYHKRVDCIALQQCPDSISVITIAEAVSTYNRRKCKICFNSNDFEF